jgi:hypothetical protein
MAQVSSRRSLNTEAEVHARSIPVEFVADKVALGQVFSPSYLVFSCHYYSTVAFHTHI